MKIAENQFVIFSCGPDHLKLQKIKIGQTIHLGRTGSIEADLLIDQPLNLTYDLYNQKELKIVPVDELNKEFSIPEETGANNQEILDDRLIQKLTSEEIEMMKSEKEGKEIIHALVSNNEAFDKKNEMSKLKYIKRKEKKFMKRFTIWETTIYRLCELAYLKNPQKTLHLRPDILGSILHRMNIYTQSRMLVVDDIDGLFVAGVLSRLEPVGQVFALHKEDQAHFNAVQFMNYSTDKLNQLKTLSWKDLEPREALEDVQKRIENLPEERQAVILKKYQEMNETRQLLLQGGFDGLLIGSTLEPVSIIQKLLPLISWSRPIIVYSQYSQPLVKAFLLLRENSEIINVQIYDHFHRDYQVFPNRFHPENNTHSPGGYFMTMLRVSPEIIDLS